MHNHSHNLENTTKKPIVTAIAIIMIFALLELLTGWWSHSLALISDASHMGADALTLVFAAAASWLAARPSSSKHTFGLGRAEVVASWLSSLLLICVTVGILVAAIHRLHQPSMVASTVVIIMALFGFVTNFCLAWVLGHGEKNLNTRAALLHVLSDLLGSIAVLISGAVIHFTNWTRIDPILSIIICILIIGTTISLLRESLLILMEGVPRHIDIAKIEAAILNIEDVETIHDLHVWTISSGTIALTAHVIVTNCSYWPEVMRNIKQLLATKYDIQHITLQAEAKQTAGQCIACFS